MTREEREKHLDWLYRLKSEICVFMPKDWLIPFADALDMAIEALEHEPKSEWQKDHEILKAYSDGASEVLEKIRAEIEQTTSRYSISRERGGMGQVEWSDSLIKESEVLKILDKYKGESE